MSKVVASEFRLPDDSLVFDQKNILGTVSQAAGVPTGRIIERGSNANGEYVRFADGALIQNGSVSFDFANWTTANYALPHAFASALYTVSWAGTGSPGSADRNAQSSAFVGVTSETEWRFTITVTGGGTRNIRWSAIGRWF